MIFDCRAENVPDFHFRNLVTLFFQAFFPRDSQPQQHSLFGGLRHKGDVWSQGGDCNVAGELKPPFKIRQQPPVSCRGQDACWYICFVRNPVSSWSSTRKKDERAKRLAVKPYTGAHQLKAGSISIAKNPETVVEVNRAARVLPRLVAQTWACRRGRTGWESHREVKKNEGHTFLMHKRGILIGLQRDGVWDALNTLPFQCGASTQILFLGHSGHPYLWCNNSSQNYQMNRTMLEEAIFCLLAYVFETVVPTFLFCGQVMHCESNIRNQTEVQIYLASKMIRITKVFEHTSVSVGALTALWHQGFLEDKYFTWHLCCKLCWPCVTRM